MLGADPIHCTKMIKEIYDELEECAKPVYADIFKLGILLGLRGGDLLNIKFENITTNKLTIVEIKTKKTRELKLNDKALAIVNKRRVANPNHIYLFQSDSRNTKRLMPLAIQSVNRVFNKIGESHRLKLSTHSLRKTFGYLLYKKGVAVELLAKVFNHSSTAETLLYIGITKQDVLKTYDLLSTLDI
jgi:integrase